MEKGSDAAKILAFKSKAPAPPSGMENSARGVYTSNSAGVKAKKTFRQIPSAPERILDAPELVDDYYLNLLDWGGVEPSGGGVGMHRVHLERGYRRDQSVVPDEPG